MAPGGGGGGPLMFGGSPIGGPPIPRCAQGGRSVGIPIIPNGGGPLGRPRGGPSFIGPPIFPMGGGIGGGRRLCDPYVTVTNRLIIN